jgi:hypothetical protein
VVRIKPLMPEGEYTPGMIFDILRWIGVRDRVRRHENAPGEYLRPAAKEVW